MTNFKQFHFLGAAFNYAQMIKTWVLFEAQIDSRQHRKDRGGPRSQRPESEDTFYKVTKY